MICYQENMYFSPAEGCTPQVFDQLTKSTQTKWLISQHRLAKRNDPALDAEEYRKYCLKEEAKPKKGAKFAALSEAEKLKRYAAHLKESLPVFIYGAKDFDEKLTAKGNPWKRRCLENVQVNGLFMFDVDHVPNPRDIYEQTRAEGFPWRVLLAHVTPSGEGLRLVCAARLDIGNIADNQIELAKTLGVRADGSCIDASRISFCPMAEEILFLDSELFTYENETFYERFNEEYRMGHTDPTDPDRKFDADDSADAGDADGDGTGVDVRTGEPGDAGSGATAVTWRGYDIQSIIDERYRGHLPCAADSNRHAESLKLASDLLVLLDGDKTATQRIIEAQSWVQEIIAERDENVRQTVLSAVERMAKKEKEGSAWVSKPMQAAIEAVCGKTYREIIQGQTDSPALTPENQTEVLKSGKDSLPLQEWGEQIAALFGKFPLLQDVCSGLKPMQYPAAVYVAGGLLMTLMTRCWYRFYHRPQEKRRLNCSLLIIGDPASGKSFATELYALLSAPIKSCDKAGKEAINRYKQEMRTKGSNKEKPAKPKALVRIHPSRTSNAQFIQDMVNAVEVVDGEEMQLHMLTFDSELDNSIQNQKGGSWIDKTSMELKAFHNEEDGQAYSNLDSPMQDFSVTWNYIYTGTPIALKKKVTPTNFGSGLATRLTVIPLPPTNFEMMEMESFESTDFERISRLKEWAFKLDATKGELTLWPIVKKLWEWTQRRMEDARDNQSKADEMLLKRCAYHGINYSAPFIVMRHWDEMHLDGQQWCGEVHPDETDWQLAELLTNIHYACQQHFFGAMAEAYFDDMFRDAGANVQRRKKTVIAFGMLPEIFTLDDIARSFKLENKASIYSRAKRLTDDHLAEKIEEGEDKGKYRKIVKMFM